MFAYYFPTLLLAVVVRPKVGQEQHLALQDPQWQELVAVVVIQKVILVVPAEQAVGELELLVTVVMVEMALLILAEAEAV